VGWGGVAGRAVHRCQVAQRSVHSSGTRDCGTGTIQPGTKRNLTLPGDGPHRAGAAEPRRDKGPLNPVPFFSANPLGTRGALAVKRRLGGRRRRATGYGDNRRRHKQTGDTRAAPNTDGVLHRLPVWDTLVKVSLVLSGVALLLCAAENKLLRFNIDIYCRIILF